MIVGMAFTWASAGLRRCFLQAPQRSFGLLEDAGLPIDTMTARLSGLLRSRMQSAFGCARVTFSPAALIFSAAVLLAIVWGLFTDAAALSRARSETSGT